MALPFKTVPGAMPLPAVPDSLLLSCAKTAEAEIEAVSAEAHRAVAHRAAKLRCVLVNLLVVCCADGCSFCKFTYISQVVQTTRVGLVLTKPGQYSGLHDLPTGREVYLAKKGRNARYLDTAAASGFLTKRA